MSKRELPPGFIVPAQPVERTVPPSGPEWVHEIKHDGYRLIVRKSGGFVQLFTRNRTDYTARLPAIAASARRLAGAFVLDGEAVVVGPDGLSRFHKQRIERGARRHPVDLPPVNTLRSNAFRDV